MISQAFLLLTAAVALQGQSPPLPVAESIKLERVYKKGDTDKYAILVNLNMDGGQGKASATIQSKVVEELKDGMAELELSILAISVVMQDQEMPIEKPEAHKAKFDKTGMPTHLVVKDEKWVYAMALFSSFAPGQVETGKEFKIAWKSADDAVRIAGAGKVTAIVVVNAKRVAVVKSTMKITPADDTPGELEVTSKIDIETGRLIESEGKLTIEGDGVTASFTVKREKA